MGKVRIILDHWGHHADADAAATVQDESSYWAARKALRDAGHGDGEATAMAMAIATATAHVMAPAMANEFAVAGTYER